MASSSASDCGGSRALPAPPPPASSSSDSAASTTTAGSSSSSSAASTISLENASNSSKFQHNSQASSAASSSSTTLIQSESVGDSTDNPTASSSGSCSDAEVEIDPVTPQPTDWTASDPCRYYPVHSDGCTNPRSCRDCLNLEADGDLSCMVNQYGRCVQKNGATYVPALDFRHQQPSNSCEQRSDQKVQFPADKVDYCPYGDTQCQRCKDSVFADVMQGRINGSLTKFCYGDGGCVCIAVCEAPIWKSTVGQTVCNGTVVNRDFDSQHANTYGGSNGAEDHDRQPLTNVLLEIVGAIAAVAVVVAAVQFARKRRRTSDDAASSSSQEGGEDSAAAEGAADAPMAVPVAPQLSLFGWQAMRSELIEREQLLLAGVEDFSNVRTGYLQLLDVDASAPPPEEDESSAPVLLVPLAGASAPTFSPRGVAALASAPSAPPVSPSAPTLLEEELL